jgi:hypothetical protein
MGLFERLYWCRHFGNTVRFHSERIVGDRPTVFHHSASTGLLLMEALGERCTFNLLRAALLHDLEEGVTGDFPAPVKWAVDDNGELSKLEASVREHFELKFPELTEEEKRWLKAADFLDVYMNCLEQRLMGNALIDRVFRRLTMHAVRIDFANTNPEFQELYFCVRNAYRQILKTGSESVLINAAEDCDFWGGAVK